MKNDEKTFLRLKRLVWGCFSLRYCDSLVIHSDETFALTFVFENDCFKSVVTYRITGHLTPLLCFPSAHILGSRYTRCVVGCSKA